MIAKASLAVEWDLVLADAAFDAEAHHAHARDESGIRSSVIPINPRGHGSPPGGTYRSQVPRRFAPGPEGRRHERRHGSAPSGKSDGSREREGYLRVLTHNLMPLATG